MTSPLQYTNRNGDVFSLQSKLKKGGKALYSFAKNVSGRPEPQLPEGYEVREHPADGRVTVRKCIPSLILPEEKQRLEKILKQISTQVSCIVDTQKQALVVYTVDKVKIEMSRYELNFCSELGIEADPFIFNRRVYQPMLEFSLVDVKKRRFNIARRCFRGSCGPWLVLERGKSLATLAKTYAIHLGEDSFFYLG